MYAIAGMTELALGESLAPQVRDYLETVHESADSLLKLVNDLLDYSKLESPDFALDRSAFHLHEVLNEAADAIGPLARSKNLKLQRDFDRDLPACLVADPARLRQILTNLLENAAKFSAVGTICFRVRVERRLAGATALRFEVADQGIGIVSADHEPHFSSILSS